MYNENRKNDYISDNLKVNVNLQSKFSKFTSLAEFEDLYGKDLCDFSFDEIVAMYKDLYCPHFYSLSATNSFLKSYTRYCQQKNLTLDNKNHYDEVTNEVIADCVNPGLLNEMILPDRNKIKTILNQVSDNPSDQFICLAIFDGICGRNYSDLSDLRFSDFNIEEKTVSLKSGKILKVESDLIELARESSETIERKSYKSNRITKLIEDEDLIIKNGVQYMDGNYAVNQKVRLKIEAVRSYTGYLVFTRKCLTDSGMIYYLNKIVSEENCTIEEAMKTDFIKDRYTIDGLTNLMRRYGKFF